MEWLKGKIKNDDGAKYFFKVFRFEDGTSLTEQKQKEYKANAEILNAIKVLYNNNEVTKKYKKEQFWTLISEKISLLTDSPHSLPINIRRLREKYLDYVSNGYYSLVHKNYKNQNSRKVNSSIVDLILSIKKQFSTKNPEKINSLYESFFSNEIEVKHYDTNELINKNDLIRYVELSTSTIENYLKSNPKVLISKISFDKMESDLHNEFYESFSDLNQKNRIDFLRIFLEIIKTQKT